MPSILIALSLVLVTAPSRADRPDDDPIAAFEAWTGARLSFTRKATPEQVLYRTTPTLTPERRRDAARILLEHAHH